MQIKCTLLIERDWRGGFRAICLQRLEGKVDGGTGRHSLAKGQWSIGEKVDVWR